MNWKRRAFDEDPELSARDVSDILGMPFAPTPQQARIIEAPREPALVVAGAGSGKTETMAARVVWLIANGYVAPHEILGLTFTRKAAGQLAARIRDRVTSLALAGYAPSAESDDIEGATVSTYNAFANRIYGHYAVHIGLDPDATVIGDATAWQIARDVVKSSFDVDVPRMDKRLNDITGGVLDISRALNDHVARPDDVIELGLRFRKKLDELRPGYAAAKRPAKDNFDATDAYALSLPVLVRLAQDYDRAKRDRGLIEFSDQVRYALEICDKSPTVVADLRASFPIVLLDEYQDTSVVQTRLLTRVFGGTPVMAVGDPHQSIYGWRGASATNMSKFAEDFGVSKSGDSPYPLQTSWRNPSDVLRAANRYVDELRQTSPIAVEQLEARDGAPSSSIEVAFFETIDDETEAVAQWFADRLSGDENSSSHADAKSAAILFRAARPMAAFRAALERHNVPAHIVGLGGLLDEPVIVDLVCALRVLHDATADSELVRLLAGPRWMIAPRDLVGLRRVAQWLSRHDHRRAALDDAVRAALRESVTSEDSDSLIDALDFIASTTTDYEVFSHISSEGMSRLREAGAFFARLRQHASFDLRELVTFVYQELLLDIEVAANSRARGAWGAFDAFLEPLSNFVATTDHPTLGSFLGWLREAERRDKIAPASPDEERGVVQLMTIHAAKGLEWDLVAIPRMVDKELPGDRSRADTWRKFGALPYEFRGDSDDLPEWTWESSSDVDDLFTRYDSFREDVRSRFDDEERRLAYVAITRTKNEVLLTGSHWNTQKTPRQPSVFLREIIDAGIVSYEIPAIENEKENPRGDNVLPMVWPQDPLGDRRTVVIEAAESVRGLLTTETRASRTSSWDEQISALVFERDVASRDVLIPAPRRIAASKFKDFVSEPAEVAAQLRRPMPQEPYRATLLGTVFHEWVEYRSARAATEPGDLLEALEQEDDPERHRRGPVDDRELQRLKDAFVASEWGDLKPVDVEREIHIVIAGVSVVCKIDAVYRRTSSDGSQRVEIVDWKTGKPPRDDEDYELKQTQLALYRIAYARWANIRPEDIDAAFYFVADDIVLRPERLMSEYELVARWNKMLHRDEDPPSP